MKDLKQNKIRGGRARLCVRRCSALANNAALHQELRSTVLVFISSPPSSSGADGSATTASGLRRRLVAELPPKRLRCSAAIIGRWRSISASAARSVRCKAARSSDGGRK